VNDLKQTVTTLIALTDNLSHRSLQRRIGPSEVGTPCLRRLAYKLHDEPEPNASADSWLATVGTAVHAWLAEALQKQNQLLGRERWLVEQRVQIRMNLSGSTDAYDTDTDTVIDWKVVGPTRLKEYKANGPGLQYRSQGHLYGAGWENAGRTPKTVAIVFLPRNAPLNNLHVWSEPYDRTVAQAALDRLDAVTALLGVTEPEKTGHAGWAQIPATGGHACLYCPFYRAGSQDLATGCPGDPDNPVLPRRSGLESLIA
jgi:hypothetical protein